MKRYNWIVILLLLCTSCTVTEDGNVEFTWMFYLAIIGFVALIIKILLEQKEDKTATTYKLKKIGLKPKGFILCGKYVGGHPDADDEITPLVFYANKECFNFYYRSYENSMPEKRFSIPIDSVDEIAIEDATTVDSKITAGRILLVGVFALAWKKKKKNELAFTTIEWNDGKFTHNTIFSFEGESAMQQANTFRNILIRKSKEAYE